ncbi:ABC transporter ATP-binding protein [Clostridium sp. MB40-C1]|uniref:ABC transporter ATP-binding protein n=1 Tax=Clostridium sp. MB40-C1 TaxID=3070996 RepID=UPI0027E0AF30|nr:ABC transporter ATP-binding protein [Clostridium sp. MB40-C1]WMJ80645.1 ABC transporter ATP-binding protein [Clostridium sp. MB40-C1]
MFAIETNSLTKNYGKNRGVEDINLSINEGEFYGFIGPNGAGKSTTIRLLLNFIYPTSGSAKIFGKDCIKESKLIKEELGFVPSEVNYYKNMKVDEILSYAQSFKKEKDSTKLEKLCEIFEVDRNKLVGELSLGNKKKIAIIQALLNSPKLLILDEPTNGLDPLMQKRLFNLLVEENKNGTTIFFSSHNLVEVQKFCHRTAIIRDGKLIEVKKLDELLGNNVVKVTIVSKESLNNLLDNKHISMIKKEENKTSFLFDGDINILVKEIKDINLNELKIEDPALEDTFMSYYESEDN